MPSRASGAGGEARAGAAGETTLTIFAAASLTEAFGELGKQFEAAHPGARLIFNFAGSQHLRAQMEQGANADVFASANAREMDNAVAASLVVSGTQQTFALNRLVVIFPQDNPAGIRSLPDLARPGIKLDLADRSVPVGQYTLEMLEKMSRDPAFGPDFGSRVQANVVSLEDNVRSVVRKVQLGEADAGVVYSSDVTGQAAEDLGSLAIPEAYNQLASYPIAPLAAARHPELAGEFVRFVLSDAGQRILDMHGFIGIASGAE